MSRDYCDYVIDLLSPWAEVSAKAMFGGFGIYRQGQIFGIILDDMLYFKTDETNRLDYESAGTLPCTYESKGKQIVLSYWQVPDEVLEDEEMLKVWAEKAYQLARSKKKK